MEKVTLYFYNEFKDLDPNSNSFYRTFQTDSSYHKVDFRYSLEIEKDFYNVYLTGDYKEDDNCEEHFIFFDCIAVPTTILNTFCPRLNTKTLDISYFKDFKDWKRGKRTTTKFRKFLLKVNPILTQKQLDYLYTFFEDRYKECTYTFFQDKNFESVYREKPAPYTSSFNYSCINGSCMGYSKNDDFKGFHPVNVYDNSDWDIVYCRDEKGRLSARTLVYLPKNLYVNIYSCNQKSGNALAKHLEDLGFECSNLDEDYYGAKLNKIEYRNRYIMPYLDICQDLRDCGEYFEMCKSRYSEACGNNQSGFLGYEIFHCQCCGDSMQEDDIIYVDYECYCSSCAKVCDSCGEGYTVSGIEVFSTHSRRFTNCVCPDCIDDVTEIEEEFFYVEDVQEDEEGNLFCKKYHVDVTGEWVKKDGKYYHKNSKLLEEKEESDEQ